MVQRYGRRGGEILVNTTTEGTQGGGNMAATADGGFIATWTDFSGSFGDASSSEADIKGQRFDSAGNKVGPEFLVNSTTFEFQSDSKVTVLQSGAFVVTWTDNRVVDDVFFLDVRARLFHPDGTPVGEDFVVHNFTAGGQISSAVAALSGGGFVVAWSGANPGDSSSIGVQLFDSSGNRLGDSSLANTTLPFVQSQPSVAALASGGFVVSWTDSSQSGGDTSAAAIRLQQFDSAGAKVGPEKLVNTVTDMAQNASNVIALSGGGFLVTWVDASTQQDSSGTGIKGQLFTSDGAPVGNEFLMNAVTEGDQRRPRASSLPDGGFIVTWESSTASAIGVDIKAQLFDSAGNKVGAEFLMPVESLGNQVSQNVVTLASGAIAVGWTENTGSGSDTSETAVVVQLIGPSEAAPSDIALDNLLVSETATEHQAVATFSTEGVLNSSFTYTLVSDSTGGAFAIENGKLVVANNDRLDFETAKTADIRVRTTDDEGRSYEESFQLAITDTPEQGFQGGAEFLVNSTRQGNQSEPIGATLADGSVVLLWRQSPNFDNSVGRGKIVSEDGNPLTDELSIDALAVAALPGGGFATVGQPSEGFHEDLSVRLFNASGDPVGSEIPIRPSIMGHNHSPSIAVRPSGEFAVAWVADEDEFTGGLVMEGVYIQLFSAGGVPVGFAQWLDTWMAADPQVTVMDSGYLVSWSEFDGTIRAQMLDLDGDRLGNQFQINVPGEYAVEPHMAPLASGGFVATWLPFDGFTRAIGPLKAQIFDADGVKVGDPIVVGSPSALNSIDVVGLGWGGFVVTWAGVTDPAASNDFDVKAQVFDATGARVGTELSINVPAAGNQLYTNVEALESGGFLVSWTDLNPAGDGNAASIGARIFTPVMPGATLQGTAGDDSLEGTAVADRLTGLGGNDTLDGRAGGDTMIGGPGNDTYVVGNAADRVVEAAAAGADTVRSSIGYRLGDNVENLVLTGAASIDGTGNALANSLVGNPGDNRLDGRAGADTMRGGAGDDTYTIDVSADTVIETRSVGSDTVRSPFSFTLGDHFENLVLIGAAAVNGAGNDGANAIVGNSAANILDGGAGNDRLDGGAGADTMMGGAGNDSYFVDHSRDRALESSSGDGIDTVRSSADFRLGNHVENLVLTGRGAVSGTGNALANSLTGNAAANALDGGGGNDAIDGGAGADTMSGAYGDDVYYVDRPGDKVVEVIGAGTDTVRSSITVTLATQVENLVLTGTSAIGGTGNSLANTIVGNTAANALSGGRGHDSIAGGLGNDRINGGTGSDQLRGGAGADDFLFDAPLGATNVDQLLDFAAPSDTLFLHRSIFAAAGANGTLASSAFHKGGSAAEADDRIVYDQAAGKIFYDADGSGGGDAILFATVTPGAAMSYADFVIYG